MIWTDYIAEAAFAAVMLADCIQTVQIGKAKREVNPILGTSPGRAKVWAYFSVLLAAHAVGAFYVPQPWLALYQWIPALVEAFVVGRNLGLGWRFWT
jgi:hypothetical protein